MNTYIARDTYAGIHTACKNAATVNTGRYTAQEMATMFGTDTVFILWESFGTIRPGVEGFARVRFIADTNGNLHGYNADGARSIIHPAERALRILTR